MLSLCSIHLQIIFAVAMHMAAHGPFYHGSIAVLGWCLYFYSNSFTLCFGKGSQ